MGRLEKLMIGTRLTDSESRFLLSEASPLSRPDRAELKRLLAEKVITIGEPEPPAPGIRKLIRRRD